MRSDGSGTVRVLRGTRRGSSDDSIVTVSDSGVESRSPLERFRSGVRVSPAVGAVVPDWVEARGSPVEVGRSSNVGSAGAQPPKIPTEDGDQDQTQGSLTQFQRASGPLNLLDHFSRISA